MLMRLPRRRLIELASRYCVASEIQDLSKAELILEVMDGEGWFDPEREVGDGA